MANPESRPQASPAEHRGVNPANYAKRIEMYNRQAERLNEKFPLDSEDNSTDRSGLSPDGKVYVHGRWVFDTASGEVIPTTYQDAKNLFSYEYGSHVSKIERENAKQLTKNK